MFNVLLALRRAPAQLGHAALATSNLRRPPSPTIYPDARRSAATLTGHVEPAPAASVLEPEPAEPLPHSDLQEFITILSTADSLSPAAVSRSAARVIRSSVKNGNVAEAVIILSALRAANDRRTVSGNAARFPLRLPSTTLVHGLLQQNNIHQAARFARDVMPVQEHLFRVKTIDVVIKALCPAPAPGEVGGRSASERMTMWKRSLWTREGWKLKPLPLRGSPESLAPLAWPTSAPVAYPSPPFAAPGQTASPHLDVNHPLRVQADPQERGQGLTASTRMAIALLAQARRTKQRRTNDMYKRVVDVCLFQGEIVTATLLFAILLYDLRKSQMRQQPSETLENTESVLDTPAGEQAIRRFCLNRGSLRWTEFQAKEIYERFQAGIGDCAELPEGDHPSTAWNLMRKINWEMSELENRDSREANRARGILATMWLLWGMPFPQISLLIKCLYSVKKTETPWPPWGDQRSTLYGFCHAVLARETVRLTALGSKYGDDPTKQPPPDLRSCNTLLHYNLRHRLSPSMAEAILHHMEHKRDPPIQPDQATYGILLRTASLLRQNGTAGQILQRFAGAKGEEIVSTLAGLEGTFPAKYMSPNEVFRAPLAINFPVESTSSVPLPEIQLGDLKGASEHVINSIIAHYISTGRVDLVVRIIPTFLPTLQGRILDKDERIAALHRMVVLGPATFTSLLNACVKAGKTGLAERIWRLAMVAERASWSNGPWGEARHGWLLGIETYTLMMQLYAKEGRIGLIKIKRAKEEYIEVMRKRNLYAVGWGRELQYPAPQHRDLPPHGEIAQVRERWLVARQQGIRFIRSTRYGGMEVFRRVQQTMRPRPIPEKIAYDPRATRRFMTRPMPDARFFNACLDLFGRVQSMHQRREQPRRRGVWMRAYHKALEDMSRHRLRKKRDDFLPYILEWMRQLRFPIPVAFAHVQSKTDDTPHGFAAPELTAAHLRARQHVRPFAYRDPPPEKLFQPFRIPVTKDRGLPIKRRGDFPRGRARRSIVHRFWPKEYDGLSPEQAAARYARDRAEKRKRKKEAEPADEGGERTDPTQEEREAVEEQVKEQVVPAAVVSTPSRWDVGSTRSHSAMYPRRRAVVRPSLPEVEPVHIGDGSAADRALAFAFSM